MEHERLIIEIAGAEQTDLYTDLITLEVELDDELAGMFRLTLATAPQADGSWPYLDDERLVVWQPVTIAVGFDSGVEELISGFLTHIRPSFDPDPTRSTLELWGMDGSVLMDRVEKRQAWPSQKDSDIAAALFRAYGFTPQMDDTAVIHDEAISTIIQRETDMQFLKRLALRNGYDCYVEGETGYFRRPLLDETPQPLLAAHFGQETTVIRFSAEINALAPTHVSMAQLDRFNKEVLVATVEENTQTALGDTTASALLPPGMESPQTLIGMNTTTGLQEMEALCRGLFDEADWFVTGEGVIDARTYGHVLKPRRTVTIKGVGETYSGIYYVNHVTHTLSAEGYQQAFRVKRNGIKPTGAEDFTAPANGLI
ncbi:MAG: hypothetical protein KDE19_04895 [Caldilineaceae bacterium]|nr:hypothetical protein [Caldilineaceae bacterium]